MVSLPQRKMQKSILRPNDRVWQKSPKGELKGAMKADGNGGISRERSSLLVSPSSGISDK
jgi:hypothetical protein